MAAGVKAGLLFLKGEEPENVKLTALDGTNLEIPVASIKELSNGIETEIVKYSGDDPDITNGTSVFTKIRLKPDENGVTFLAGKGIGIATKPGLSMKVGEPAINPGPKKMVQQVVNEVFGEKTGIEVTVSIPAGEDLAKRTLNPVLGIENGISVIGTTGVLRPMSEEAFKTSLVPQISVAMASGYNVLVFVPGKIGEDIAVRCGVPSGAVVQMSNFVGYMLEKAVEYKVKQVLLFGHLGKLVKVAAGVFYTHNRVGDARLETLAAYCAAEGLPKEGVKKILAAVTTEEAANVISEYGMNKVYDIIAARASLRAERLIFNELKIGTVLVSMKGEIMGLDNNARDIGKEMAWNIQ